MFLQNGLCALDTMVINDETIDLTQNVSSSTSTMLTAGGILMLSAIIVFFIVIMKRWNGRLIPAITGLISYMLFGFILTNIITAFIMVIPGADDAFKYNENNYTIVYQLILAVGFTFARFVTAKILDGRYERKGDVYISGIGLAVGECILYGMTVITYNTWCMALQTESLAQMFEGFTDENILSTYHGISSLFIAPSYVWLLQGISYVMDIIINVALIMVVYGAIKNVLPKWVIAVSGAMTFLSQISFQIYNPSSETSILLWFAFKIAVFGIIVYYAFKVVLKNIEFIDN